MKKYCLIIVVLLLDCNQEKNNNNKSATVVKTEESKAETVDLIVYDYNTLEPLLNKKDGKVYVINFWAT